MELKGKVLSDIYLGITRTKRIYKVRRLYELILEIIQIKKKNRCEDFAIVKSLFTNPILHAVK